MLRGLQHMGDIRRKWGDLKSRGHHVLSLIHFKLCISFSFFYFQEKCIWRYFFILLSTMKSTLVSLLLSILLNAYLFYSILYLSILYLSWLSCPYLCLSIHAYIHICYKDFSIHVSLTIRVYIFVNIYLSKLCYQYICLDILAFI